MTVQRWRVHPQHMPGLRGVLPVLGGGTLGVLLAWSYFSDAALGRVAGYLTLHMVLETLSIAVSFLVFAVGWKAHSMNPQRNVFILACGFLGVAVLDFSHMLSYAGMPDYITPGSVEKGINFWLPARYMGALSLLLALLLPWRAVSPGRAAGAHRYLVLGIVALLVVCTHVLVFWFPQVLPATYVQPGGLTPFKIAAEYGVMVVLGMVVVLLLRRLGRPAEFNVPELFAAVWVMGLSEFFFTLYVSANDHFNLLGHLYKVVAYIYLYRAIFIGTIEAPYQALSQSEKDLRAVLDAVPDLMFEVTQEGRYIRVYSQQPELLTVPSGQILGHGIHETLPPEAAAVAQSALAEAAEKGFSRGSHYGLDLPDGKHWFELSIARKSATDDGEARFVVLSRDITQRMVMLETLRKLLHAVEQTPNSIFITDLQARIEYVNPAFTATTGYRLEDVQGRNPKLLSAGKTPRSLYQELWSSLLEGKSWKGEFLNRRKDGREYHEAALISPLHDEHGDTTHYLSIQEDITDRKRDEERIRKLVNFDILTGLPNRTLFASRFSQALALTQRSGRQLALMYLDLDHFKNVNDSLGHQVGDDLLVELAQRLQSVLREEDTVCRQGGG